MTYVQEKKWSTLIVEIERQIIEDTHILPVILAKMNKKDRTQYFLHYHNPFLK